MAAPRGVGEAPYLIGLGYQKQVGKDTLARLLQGELIDKGYDVRIYSIADPLKALVTTVFGVPRELVYGGDAEKNQQSGVGGRTVRQLLQDVGCRMREAWPGIWSGALMRSEFAKDPWMEGTLPDFVIVPDVRFPDEFEIVQCRGLTVKVTRPGAPKDPHPSETNSPIAWAEWAYEVVNDGNMDALAAEAAYMAEIVVNKNPHLRK